MEPCILRATHEIKDEDDFINCLKKMNETSYFDIAGHNETDYYNSTVNVGTISEITDTTEETKFLETLLDTFFDDINDTFSTFDAVVNDTVLINSFNLTVNDTGSEIVINQTTTELYEYDDDYFRSPFANKSEYYNRLQFNSQTMFFGSCLTFFSFFVFFILYFNRYRKCNFYVNGYISIQHAVWGLLHLFVLSLYSASLGTSYFKFIFDYILNYIEIVTPLWTMVTSCIVILQLFLFGFNTDLYTKKEVTLFSLISASVILFYKIIVDLLIDDDDLAIAIQMSSMFLIISVPIIILFLITIYVCKKSGIPLNIGLFYAFHLLLLISSDIILIHFSITILYNGTDRKIFTLSILLIIRLIAEGIWFISSSFMISFVSKPDEHEEEALQLEDIELPRGCSKSEISHL